MGVQTIGKIILVVAYLKSKNLIGNNKLIFANKTKGDIILAHEFKKLLGKNFINILSDEKTDEYAHGQITQGFLKAHISDSTKNVYICGPPPMMKAIEKQLANLKIDEKLIIKEVF